MRRSASALDCRTVRQRRFTSSLRLASPARNLPTLSCTKSLLPRHRFPVASSLAQPHIASSALKSGLYCTPADSPAAAAAQASAVLPHRLATPELAEGAPARCPRPRSMAQGASTSVALKRPPMSRRCCCPPAPSTPPRRSPSILQNSSWPSRHAVGWSSPPVPVLRPGGLESQRRRFTKVGKRDGRCIDMEAAESLFKCLEQVSDPRGPGESGIPFKLFCV